MRIPIKTVNDNKGFSLIIAITIIAIVAFIVMAIMPQALNQRSIAKREADSIRAFYAADSGLNKVAQCLNAKDWSGWDTTNPDLYVLSLQPLVDTGSNTIAYYEVEAIMTDPENPSAESSGYSPTTNDSKKSISSSFQRGEIAIMTKGTVDIRGNAEINGRIIEHADFDFETIFNKTIEEVKADDSTEVIIDPPNNYDPVPAPAEDYTDVNGNSQYDAGEPFDDDNANGEWDDEKDTTWFHMVSGGTAMITQEAWEGEGILVVEGNLKITGGDFEGVLWIMGDLTMAVGNADISGTIFVDGDFEAETVIGGTVEIEYDEDDVVDAFGRNPMPYVKTAWREIYK